MRRLGTIFEVLRVVAIVFLVAVSIRYFVFQPFQVEGSSMEPGFHSGEFLLIEKLSYRFRGPQRGEVIVFKYPKRPTVDYIKRIIGLPGETVRIQDGTVLISGEPLSEPYLDANEQTVVSNNPQVPYEITLDRREYFVMGDNRTRSSDSREWGPLAEQFIIGRSSLILYPTAEFKAVASPKYRN